MAIEQRFLSTKTVATRDENGVWTVISDMTAGMRDNESDWDTRTIGIKSIDKLLERAVKTATTALEKKYKALDGDLFNLPKEEDGIYFPYPLNNHQT